MRRLVMILAAACVVSMPLTPAYGDTVLEPFSCNFDFESGSVGAWSSYPPSQDTAYDPTIWVKPLYMDRNVKNRALYREITPNYEIDTIFGVRKKNLEIYVDGTSVLSFKCFIKSNRDIAGVKVRFGFADGTDVERMIPFTARSTWRDCSISLSDILPQGSMKKLDAIAFMAVCSKADPENLLRFGLDDVKINGKRESQWQFSAPRVHKLAEWPEFIAATHFKEGDTITIAGNPPFDAGSAAVVLSQAFTGEDSKNLRMKKTGDVWSLSIPLTEKNGIVSGIWRATVKASSKVRKNDTISTDLVFLVKRADAPGSNPRLLMKPGDAPKIREKASSGRMLDILNGLTAEAKRYRDSRNVDNFRYNLDAYDQIYWLPTYGGYIQAISVPSSYIRSNGVVYGITGDTEAGDAAKKALLMMAKWPSFVHPHILNQGQFTYWPVGQKLADLAIGFDMAADRFTPAERREAAQALYSKGITEVFKEYVRDNRVSSCTSNWIGDVTAGGILCTLAVMNDYGDEDLEPYLTGMLLKLNALMVAGFDRDGAYGEGFSYLAHAMHCINPALKALDLSFGIRFPEKVAQSYMFLFYQGDATSKELFDFGDSTDRLGRMTPFTYFIAKNRDPRLKWLYDLTPGRGDEDLLLMDDSIPSRGPDDLPAVTLFRDTGTAIFKSGFGHDDFTFIFRCGPFYNHQHFDQGGFYLVDQGEDFLNEVGRSDYYYDPWYQKLVIQPGGHNCILIDGNPESQRHGDLLHDVPAWNNHAAITDFVRFDSGGFASGRLDPIYNGKLDVLRRSVLYYAPRTAVIIDEAAGPHDAREINLRFHAPRMEDIAIQGKGATITSNGRTLIIRTVSPSACTLDIMKRPLTLAEFGREDAVTMKARGFLQMTAPLGTGGATFVNVLSTDERAVSGLRERSSDTFTELTLGNIRHAIKTAPGKDIRYGDIETDALVYANLDGGFLAFRATKVKTGSGSVLETDKPVSVVFRNNRLDYSAADATGMRLKLASKPGGLVVNGEKVKDWTFDKQQMLTISLTAGSGTVVIQ